MCLVCCCGGGDPQYKDEDELPCVLDCMRWAMFAVNFIIFALAAGLLAYVSYMLGTQWKLLAYADNMVPIFMFITFAFVMLLTTLGSLGACNLSKCLLISYTICTVLTLGLEGTMVGLVLSNKFNTEKFIADRWASLTQQDKQWFQSQLNCCTYNGQIGSDLHARCPSNFTPCKTRLDAWVQQQRTYLIVIAAGLAFVELFGVIVAIMLLRQLNQMRKGSYDNVELQYNRF